MKPFLFLLLFTTIGLPNFVSASTPLPAPIDVPVGPGGFEISGEEPGPFSTDTPGNAPAISAVSDPTFPDETLAITGFDLEGAHLQVWAGGETFSIEPLRTAGDRMQAVVPAEAPLATMLVWPVREGKAGAPIRVNGATAWWAWPAKIEADQKGATVRVFGKSLKLREDLEPKLVLVGEAGTPVQLQIQSSNPYHLEGKLPADLPPGQYSLFAHNGSGGSLGWSEQVVFEVVSPLKIPDSVFEVDDYLEEAGGSDREAIILAIAAAEKNGGGIVRFAARHYRDVVGIPDRNGRPVKDTIVLPEGVPIVLQGAGRGDFEWKTVPVDPEQDLRPVNWKVPLDAFAGEGTLISSAGTHQRYPVFELRGRGQRIEDLTLVVNGQASGGGWEMAARISGVHLLGPDQKILRSRLVRGRHCDLQLVLCAYDDGPAGQEILDTELYHGSRAITIGSGTNFVRIAGCSMKGHHSQGRYAGVNSISNRGGDNFILENSTFTSVDRTGGKIMGRTYLAGNDLTSDSYIAGNRTIWAGTHSSVPGAGGNGSEQYLFHVGETDGGLFEVRSAGPDSVELDESAAKIWQESVVTLPHRAPTERLGEPRRGRWMAFVAAGRGVGQWRLIDRNTSQGATFQLLEPWRVQPDADSKIILQRVFSHNTVFNNYIDPSPDPKMIEDDHKTVGVYWYHNCFDNITAGNEMKNIGTGVAHAFDVREDIGRYTINAWNHVRENRFENVTGTAGGTAALPVFYSEHHRGGGWEGLKDDFDYWTAVGNVFRSNRGNGADAIAQISWHRFDEIGSRGGRSDFEEVSDRINYEPGPNKGILLSVVENNVLTGATRGVLLSAPSNWTLFRNNILELTDPEGEVFEFFGPDGVLDLLVIKKEETPSAQGR